MRWAVLLLLAITSLGLTACESGEFADMSCQELTTQMLKMTGVDASEPYDLERVKAINEARAEKGCQP